MAEHLAKRIFIQLFLSCPFQEIFVLPHVAVTGACGL